MIPLYEVLVGNIGTVYSGPLWKEALRDYQEYKRQSKSYYGRAAGEPVTFLRDGEVKWEHTPKRTLDDTIDELSEETVAVMKDRNGCEGMTNDEFRAHWKALRKKRS